ncbi:helix-turn-helix domain-containing protein [Carnobacterium sp. CS13]|uniref:helix-turn-helix domain-containing protein n=1 Tax=Carnobacterium sp. CS13 TaxID=2800128 RepID=UPI0019123460|nr:helix-turn-helix domain-containing protein [Carnobacterium sp. CS13]QQP69620.1 helix-turn-helix domain-containing protein [Carnobacterium sp. CS13]
MINNLLDTSSARRLQLLEVLVAEDEWWTIEELSYKLRCSVGTIRADIQYYNSLLSGDAFIETSKQHGIKLTTVDSFQMESVYRKVMEGCLNFQIIDKLFELDIPSIEDLAELLYTSASSIIRSLKQINVFLGAYDLAIQSKPVKIIGTEKQIRYFFSIFLWDYYSASFDEFHHHLLDTAQTYIELLPKNVNTPNFSEIAQGKVALWLVICLERIEQGYFIDHEYEIFPFKVSKKEPLFDLLQKDLSFTIPLEDQNFMTYLYQNKDGPLDKTYLAGNLRVVGLSQEILAFIEALKKQTGYTLENQSCFITNLIRHYFYRSLFKGPGHILIDRVERNGKALERNFDKFTKAVRETLAASPSNNWVEKMRENENDLIFTLITFWTGLTQQVAQEKEKVQVVVVSQYGLQHELFLADMLRIRFSLELKCYTLSEQKHLGENIQLMLTDCQIELMKQWVDPAVKVLSIESIPSNRNWKKIRQVINEIQQNGFKSAQSPNLSLKNN